MALYQGFMVVISFIFFLITITPHLSCATASKKSSGFSLKLIHRDSPESPLYPGDNLTFHEKMSRYAKWNDARVSYLASIVTKNATTMDSIIRPQVYPDGYYYMVNVGIGTPKQEVWLLLDTGADLTWTQCLPCESCYEQRYPIYDSFKSETFKPLHCDHPLCSDILQCTANDCWYELSYGGISRTTGLAINETLTFVMVDGVELRVLDVIIGCSKNNQNFIFERTGNIGGIMGLNPDPHSLVSQLDSVFQRKFSYCLSPDPTQFSYLRFGNDIVVRGTQPLQSTPIVRISDIFYYGLNLVDIDIAGIPINYPPGTFAVKEDGTGGCFIDSGAPSTLIEQPAFDTFIAAYENYFARTPLRRNTQDCPPNTYCYFMPQGVRDFPHITLHFEGGAQYYLSPERYMNFDDSFTFYMLMFGPADRTILGAWQQHNVRIIYDLNEGNLYFAPEECRFDVEH